MCSSKISYNLYTRAEREMKWNEQWQHRCAHSHIYSLARSYISLHTVVSVARTHTNSLLFSLGSTYYYHHYYYYYFRDFLEKKINICSFLPKSELNVRLQTIERSRESQTKNNSEINQFSLSLSSISREQQNKFKKKMFLYIFTFFPWNRNSVAI